MAFLTRIFFNAKFNAFFFFSEDEKVYKQTNKGNIPDFVARSISFVCILVLPLTNFAMLAIYNLSKCVFPLQYGLIIHTLQNCSEC